MKDIITVGFIGNPNCGKTTLFNSYTGAKLKTANWPGVTIEKKEGIVSFFQQKLRLVDLPGVYSLTSYTMEEKLSLKYILSADVDCIVNVLDAGCLERSLYLTLQLIELGKPLVLALNMMDIVKERGIQIDLKRFSNILGILAVPVCARKKQGLDALINTIIQQKNKFTVSFENKKTMLYSNKIETSLSAVTKRLMLYRPNLKNPRWFALKILEHDTEIIDELGVDFFDIVPKSLEKEIINQKYDFIENIISKVLVNKSCKEQKTDTIDKLLTHSVLGIPIFLCIMAFVFFLTFSVGDMISEHLSCIINFIKNTTASALLNLGAGKAVTSLILDGIISGVGGILTFLPNIFILFLCLAILEDSGYMSRAAYVMDSSMSKIGLNGKAFIPMLLGFGCTVPAAMASRVLKDPKERLHTILITPFMSCSAKLPVYVLFSHMFFGKHSMLAAYSMYIIGLFSAIITSFIMRFTEKKNGKPCLLIELPEYKTPNVRSISIYVLEKVKDYLSKAGTTIFAASVILWFFLNFNKHGMCSMNESFAAKLGKTISPAFKPAGLGYWQIIVALIGGIAAKEVVISSCSVLFAITSINSKVGMAAFASSLTAIGFTRLNSYCLMLFCLLYTPCIASLVMIKKETGKARWAVFSFIYHTAIAWIAAFAVFNIALLFNR